jgi:hypothetical protein
MVGEPAPIIGADLGLDKAKIICGRCYDEVDEVFGPLCAERPEALADAPLGQYHCPDCGAMVVAGLPHPLVCRACREKKHPYFDAGSKRRRQKIAPR